VLTRELSDGTEVQRMTVPLQYGPKERWYTRLVTDPNLSQGVSQVVPAMSYEISSISYDTSRKLNTLNTLDYPTDEQRKLARMYVGVPYTLTFELAILTKLQQDGFQIVEQIFPYFTPDLTFALNVIPELGLVDQIPLTLTNVTHSDDYEGNFEKIRSITWQLAFTMKVNFYGPRRKQSRIEEIMVDIYNAPLNDLENPPLYLTTEEGNHILLENGSGILADESTANSYLTTGRVARIEVVATPSDQSPDVTGEVISQTTITDWDGDVKHSRTSTNVDEIV
jgi:hypothetical protein